MLTSIPTSALKLGIGFKEYVELARNVRRMELLTREQRRRILDRADQEPSINVSKKELLNMIRDLGYDREFYEIAEIPYIVNIPLREKKSSELLWQIIYWGIGEINYFFP